MARKVLNTEEKKIVYELVKSINMGGRKDLSAKQVVQVALAQYMEIERISNSTTEQNNSTNPIYYIPQTRNSIN